MIELVFVIVVIGILTAMIIPRLDRDNRFEAASQVLNHIKYTQHLAMTEDVYNDGVANWHMGRWQIQFYACGGYAVSKDVGLNGGNPARAESAVDPQTGRSLFTDAACTMPANAADYERVNLAGYFDVAGIATSAGCQSATSTMTIGFDTLGRPYNDLSAATGVNGVVKANCDVQLNFNSGNPEVVRIHPETGYACILTGVGGNCI